MELRWCRKGNHWVNETDFLIDKRQISPTHWCNECRKEHNREKYYEHLELSRLRAAMRMRKFRAKLAQRDSQLDSIHG